MHDLKLFFMLFFFRRGSDSKLSYFQPKGIPRQRVSYRKPRIAVLHAWRRGAGGMNEIYLVKKKEEDFWMDE